MKEKITNPKNIAEHFNKFFTEKLAQIYKTKSHPLKILYRLHPKSKKGNISHHTHYR